MQRSCGERGSPCGTHPRRSAALHFPSPCSHSIISRQPRRPLALRSPSMASPASEETTTRSRMRCSRSPHRKHTALHPQPWGTRRRRCWRCCQAKRRCHTRGRSSRFPLRLELLPQWPSRHPPSSRPHELRRRTLSALWPLMKPQSTWTRGPRATRRRTAGHCRHRQRRPPSRCWHPLLPARRSVAVVLSPASRLLHLPRPREAAACLCRFAHSTAPSLSCPPRRCQR